MFSLLAEKMLLSLFPYLKTAQTLFFFFKSKFQEKVSLTQSSILNIICKGNTEKSYKQLETAFYKWQYLLYCIVANLNTACYTFIKIVYGAQTLYGYQLIMIIYVCMCTLGIYVHDLIASSHLGKS